MLLSVTHPVAITPDQVLQQLIAGNQRYAERQATHPHQSAARLHQTAIEQHPIAIILGCSDSRVPPEVIFDQGLGDLFVVRVAGHIVDDAILGSIEYAVATFGVTLIVVLGHERCGAVAAAVKHLAVPGHVSTLMQAILPALAAVEASDQAAIERAVRCNVQYVTQQIGSSQPVLATLVQAHQLKVVGARYGLDDGNITWLEGLNFGVAD